MTIHAPATVNGVAAADVATNVPMAIAAVPVNFQGGEKLGAGGVQAATVYTVTCRYRTDLTEAMVLIETCCTQRRFQILAIVPSDDRRELTMTCVTQGQA